MNSSRSTIQLRCHAIDCGGFGGNLAFQRMCQVSLKIPQTRSDSKAHCVEANRSLFDVVFGFGSRRHRHHRVEEANHTRTGELWLTPWVKLRLIVVGISQAERRDVQSPNCNKLSLSLYLRRSDAKITRRDPLHISVSHVQSFESILSTWLRTKVPVLTLAR